MSDYLLVALFLTATVASAATIADAVVRGRNAFRLLSGDAVRVRAERQITVMFVDTPAGPRMPAMRPFSAARSSQRQTARSGLPSLRAAA